MDSTDDPTPAELAAWDCQRAERPEDVPWPDFIGCPWLPWGRVKQWFVFEEPSPGGARAARRIHLSARQIRLGEVGALQIREDLLMAWFPRDARGTEIDWDHVARWLIRHIEIADQTRIERYRRQVARWDREYGNAAPPAPPAAPAPVAQPVTVMLRLPSNLQAAQIQTLHLAPMPNGSVMLAVTVAIPGRDALGLKLTLPPDKVAALRAALPEAQP